MERGDGMAVSQNIIRSTNKKPKKGEFKCYACKQIFPESVQYKFGENSKQFYCKTCATKKQIEINKINRQQMSEKKFGTEEFRDNEKIFTGKKETAETETIKETVDYILELFNLTSEEDTKQNYGIIVRQVKNLMKDYKYEPKFIYLALKYYYVFLDNPIPEEPLIINTVCLNYSKAVQTYNLQQKLIKEADNLIPETVKVVNVYVTKKQRELYNSSFDNKWRLYENMIDLSELGVEEDEE